jgi:hypothetical protein
VARARLPDRRVRFRREQPQSTPGAGQDDSFYLCSTALGGIVSYAILLGLLLLIARGLPRRETFALYRPASPWPRTIERITGTLALT